MLRHDAKLHDDSTKHQATLHQVELCLGGPPKPGHPSFIKTMINITAVNLRREVAG